MRQGLHCESMRHFMHRAGFEWNRYQFGFVRVCTKVCAGPCPLTLWILPSPTNFVDRTTNRRRHMRPWVAQMQFWLPVGMRQGMRRHFFSSIHEIAISECKKGPLPIDALVHRCALCVSNAGYAPKFWNVHQWVCAGPLPNPKPKKQKKVKKKGMRQGMRRIYIRKTISFIKKYLFL